MAQEPQRELTMHETPPAARCLNCGAAFDSQDLSPKRRFAECSHCGTLHNVSSFYAQRIKPDLHVARLPRSIQYGEGPKGATLRIQSNETFPVNNFMLALVLASSMHLLFSIAALIASPSKREGFGWLALLLGLFVWPAWYWTLATYVNHLRLTIDRFSVVAGSRPLPAMRARRFDTQILRGFMALPKDAQSANPRYRIILVDSTNKGFPLLPRYSDKHEAEALLYLLDRAVRRYQRSEPAADKQVTRTFSHLYARRLTRRHTEDVANLDMGRAQRFIGSAESSDLSCTACGAPIPLRVINRQGLFAICPYCGTLGDVREFLKVTGLPPARQVAYLPAGAQLKITPNRVELDARKAPLLDRIPNLAGAGYIALPGLLLTVSVMLAGILYTKGWKQNLLITGAAGLVGAVLSFVILWNRANPKRVSSLTRKFLVHRVGLGAKDLSYSVPADTIVEFAALEHAGEEGAEPGYLVVAIDNARCRHVVADQLTSPNYALIIRDAFQQLLETTRKGRSTSAHWRSG